MGGGVLSRVSPVLDPVMYPQSRVDTDQVCKPDTDQVCRMQKKERERERVLKSLINVISDSTLKDKPACSLVFVTS